ncbi:MAG: Uma2 family endonuclease [Acidobacteriia bacterium]|nr:Uma2 family endonuclease [Terriglobia bacterium]
MAVVPEVWLIDSQAKTVEVLKLQGKNYFVDATLAGDQVLASSLFPGWQIVPHRRVRFSRAVLKTPYEKMQP